VSVVVEERARSNAGQVRWTTTIAASRAHDDATVFARV